MIGRSPPGPFIGGSTTGRTNPAATAPSKALPPRSSIAIPAAEASQWVDETMPKVPRSSGRVGSIQASIVAAPPTGAPQEGARCPPVANELPAWRALADHRGIMLRVVDLTVEVGHRLLADEVSFTVAPNDVVGLAGPNGAGKTSLLRAIAEATQSRRNGAVSLVGKLAWLPQESPPITTSTGLARLLSARGLDRARQELEAARRRIDQSGDARARDRAIKRFSGLQER